MAAYCDFNEIFGGKAVPISNKECQQTVIFITNYKYEVTYKSLNCRNPFHIIGFIYFCLHKKY